MAIKPIRMANLLGGVSRQDDSLRHDNQFQTADNCLMDVRRGLTKRPGSHMQFAVTGLTTNIGYGVHSIDRDGSEQYIVVYGPSILKAFEPDGTIVPVTVSVEAQAYLDDNTPSWDELRLETLADYTIILNHKRRINCLL